MLFFEQKPRCGQIDQHGNDHDLEYKSQTIFLKKACIIGSEQQSHDPNGKPKQGVKKKSFCSVHATNKGNYFSSEP